MVFILLSIACSSLLIIIFKLFEKYNIDTFQAILFNYFTCVASAWVSIGTFPIPTDVAQKQWFPFALILGFFFITGFNAVGGTVKNFNMALASVMQKMSLLFAVFFAFAFYREPSTLPKVLGILFAIGAILLTSFSSDTTTQLGDNRKHTLQNWLIFPIAAWVTSGVIDILLYYVEREINKGSTDIQFIAALFATAACFGLVYFIYQLIAKKATFSFKNLLGGICLGIPNFGSIYFLLKSFSAGFGASEVFPITNVGIIICSTLVGYLVFKESMPKTKVLGILFAIIAIALIAL
jgi:drug/metabolite transporter (DMT)-like permease